MYFEKDFINKMFRLGFLLVLVLLLLDIITYFFYPGSKLGEIFLATREQTPLTWVSSVILLLIAFSCAAVYMKNKAFTWYLASLVFLFFSMDDATYLHERLSATLQESVPFLLNFPSYSWVVLYIPLMLYGLGFLIISLWKKSTAKQKRILVIAVLLLGFSLVLDMMDGWVEKSKMLVFCIDKRCNQITTHLTRLTEEISEIFGFGLLALMTIKKHNLASRLEKL